MSNEKANSRGKARIPYENRTLGDRNAHKPTDDASTSSEVEVVAMIDHLNDGKETPCRIEQAHEELPPEAWPDLKAQLETHQSRDQVDLNDELSLIHIANCETGTKYIAEKQNRCETSKVTMEERCKVGLSDEPSLIDISNCEAGTKNNSETQGSCKTSKVTMEERRTNKKGESVEITCIDLNDVTSFPIAEETPTVDLTDSRDSDSESGAQSDDGREAGKPAESEEDENNNQPLPEGWRRVSHEGGLPVYLHEESQVCVASLPYSVGTGSVRRHAVPAAAIPCREGDAGGLSSEEIHAYCSRLFRFQNRKWLHHSSWRKKRQYESVVRRYRRAGPRTVHLPVGRSAARVPFHLENKTVSMVLGEYVLLACQRPVDYDVGPLELHGQSFVATASVGGTRYGRAAAGTKKGAREAAAQAAFSAILGDPRDGDLFDRLAVEDPRVPEACRRACRPPPAALLGAALSANPALRGLPLEQCVVLTGDLAEFRAAVGPYAARVRCRNKNDGRQRAAQRLLAKIHPLVRCWGGLVRIYEGQGVGPETGADGEEPDGRPSGEPDLAMIEQLRREMLALNQERDKETMATDEERDKLRRERLMPAGRLEYTPPAEVVRCYNEMMALLAAEAAQSTSAPQPPFDFE